LILLYAPAGIIYHQGFFVNWGIGDIDLEIIIGWYTGPWHGDEEKSTGGKLMGDR